MKKSKILSLLVVAVACMFGSCSDDFLDKTPTNSYVAETYYTTDDAVLKAVEPLYNYAWFYYNYRAACGIGSIRANDGWNPYLIPEFATFQVTGLNENVCNAWSSFYMVVAMSNQLINDINEKATSDVSEDTKSLALGEAYLMRGLAYFYLVRSWGDVVVYENNDSVTANPNIPLTKQEDVLKFCERDFEQAMNLLPSSSTDRHATKYAAEAFLAKVLLAESGWDKETRDKDLLERAKACCLDIIGSGKFRLLDDYADLFKYDSNNFSNQNDETLLCLRWADPLTGTWGSMNGSFSDLAWSGSSDVNVWGGNYASIDMLDEFNKDPKDTERFLATFCLPGAYYSYWDTGNDLLSADKKTVAAGYPTPKGFVYSKKHCQLKKYVVGTKADCGGHLAQMASPLNTYLMRYSDVLLMCAEAYLGNDASSSGEGLQYINQVRERAGLDDLSSYGLDELLHERRMEFAMENMNWYDFVTWYKWKKNYMLNFFNNKQHRAFQINEGDVLMNEDGTVSYRTFPNRQSSPWYFKDWDVNTWAARLQEAGVKDVSVEGTSLKVGSNTYSSVCFWNDCLRGDDGTDVLLSGDAYKEYFDLDTKCRAQDGYDPVVINDANVFLPKPESDVLRNSYFNSPAQSYFHEGAEKTANDWEPMTREEYFKNH